MNACPHCTNETCRDCITRRIRQNAGHAVQQKFTPYADAVKWYNEAYEAITAAGGYPPNVIKQFPDELLETLIRNNIYLEYKGPKT